MTKTKKRQGMRLRILPSGDPKTAFPEMTPLEILDFYGMPKTLLSKSSKTAKCERIGVECRVLYFTSGVFCPAATEGCRMSCLGHTSGHMHLQICAEARDKRTALFLENRELFLERLKRELYEFLDYSDKCGREPAVRLNGTSDLPWEKLHPELFDEFSEISFFDYTKIYSRMVSFLDPENDSWPENYHLTFSADGRNLDVVSTILNLGGNVAMVFYPEIPGIWRHYQVIDGDRHDARFHDTNGVVVGLRAKGIAKVDLSGFVMRHCLDCGACDPFEVTLFDCIEDTHRNTVHECRGCGGHLSSSWILPEEYAA